MAPNKNLLGSVVASFDDHALMLTLLMQSDDPNAIWAYLATVDTETLKKLFVTVIPAFVDKLERRPLFPEEVAAIAEVRRRINALSASGGRRSPAES